MHRLEGGIIAPLVGFAFDRIGPKRLALFGVAMISLGFVGLSQAASFAGFVAAVLVMSAGYGSAFTANTMATVAKWFVRKRTTALGLVMAGSGLGGVLVPLLALLIDGSGWRTAALVVGVLLFVVGMPLVLVLRTSPESCGLLPDGDSPVTRAPRSSLSADAGDSSAAPAPVEFEMTTKAAMKTRAFWLLTFATSLSAIAQAALVVHAIPFLNGIGMNSALAASAVGAMSVISVGGRLFFGWLGDRFSKRWVMAGVLTLQVCGLAVFASITEPWHVFPFLALFAPGYGGAYPLRPSLQGEYFGRKAFGMIQGVLLSINAFAAFFAPIFLGTMYDTLGDYRLALWIVTIVLALSVPAILLMPKPPESKVVASAVA